ncbi:TdcA1-ORF1-ORF2 protein [Corchorus olitorius]|uniref:TdcA1-ORF1-ORF2 protein n=1 Tax=Corchorus olitorius TaxID=93759 RepID=A0A1R3K9T3_9ROSI|nr:TdcA1-ORF1-ORF2 protein [Corchorus olitorius]
MYKQFVEHEDNGITDPLLRSLAWYPSKKATSWPGCYINGYNFHTVVYGISKSTMNSGVCVRGSDSSFDFYGQLQDVVEIEYLGGGEKKILGDLSEMHVPPVDSEEEYEDASSTENEDEDDEESD